MSWKFWKKPEEMPAPGDENWERALVNRVVIDSLTEQRRNRRWGIVFKFLTFVYLFALLVLFWPNDFLESVKPGEKHTALIEVKGIIAPKTQASADKIVTALRNAYEDDKTKGIILRINSPGGSPVQAGYVNDEVRRLREKHPDIPVYAVVVDICASGGYYIAVAADEIYVDKASLVGSIGVRIDAFGLEEAIEELGIERRLLTAGKNKGILDPFSPLPEDQREFLQGILDQLHEQFIEVVKEGRGERLTGGEELFSGLFWSGEESLTLGLADELGSSSYVAREVIGAEKIVEFTEKKDLLEQFADRLGASFAESILRLTGAGGYPMAR
ncbi:MAG: S49 family peptidase [Pseudomonadota bacterium]|nr:S49 family peptidase [Pseudomonadota bacterium]